MNTRSIKIAVETAVPSGRRPRLGAAWVGAQAERSLGRVLQAQPAWDRPQNFNPINS